VTGEATKHVAVVGGGFWTHGRMELAPELGPVAVVATADPPWGIARR
jgi:hypothetical protein